MLCPASTASRFLLRVSRTCSFWDWRTNSRCFQGVAVAFFISQSKLSLHLQCARRLLFPYVFAPTFFGMMAEERSCCSVAAFIYSSTHLQCCLALKFRPYVASTAPGGYHGLTLHTSLPSSLIDWGRGPPVRFLISACCLVCVPEGIPVSNRGFGEVRLLP